MDNPGDPTDAAFLVAESKLGIADEWDARFSRHAEVPFTPSASS